MYCSNCNEPCSAVRVDIGIGHYEFAGAPGFDKHYETVSNCCEAEISLWPIEEEEDG